LLAGCREDFSEIDLKRLRRGVVLVRKVSFAVVFKLEAFG